MGKVAEEENLLDVAWEIRTGKPAETLHGFSYRGSNPVLTEKDLDAYGWASRGNLATIFFGKGSTLDDQPTDYGFLTNITNGGAEVHQLWMEQPGGTVLHRGANSAGFTAWKKILDDSNCADYVVEQGTTGIWTYRKWNSGIAECWGTYEQTNVNVSNAWGALYESSGYNVALPGGLFKETPTFTVALDSSLGCMLQMYSQGTTSSTPYWCAIRPYAGTIDNLKASITAKGRWK